MSRRSAGPRDEEALRPAPEAAALLAEAYGIPRARLARFRLYRTTKRLFALAADALGPEELPATRLLRAGLHLATFEDEGVRMSVDGAALLGPDATRVVDLDAPRFRAWMEGRGVEAGVPGEGYVILRHDGLYVGCSRVGKAGRLLNFLRKGRRTDRAADP